MSSAYLLTSFKRWHGPCCHTLRTSGENSEELTPDRAEQIINVLRNNPGVEFTLSMIADETAIPIEELAAHLEDLASRDMLIKATTTDGFDVYQFPAEFQSGTIAPPNA